MADEVKAVTTTTIDDAISMLRQTEPFVAIKTHWPATTQCPTTTNWHEYEAADRICSSITLSLTLQTSRMGLAVGHTRTVEAKLAT